MAFHIEIETNIDDASLDVESCEEVISFLENSYENVRAEIYRKYFKYSVNFI